MSTCFHCGEDLGRFSIQYDAKAFCCSGCKNVYALLSSSDLGDFYRFEKQAGTKPLETNTQKFLFLDDPKIAERFIQFKDQTSIHTTLFLPNIHCSSCIYLLENLSKLNPGIQNCQVNFTKREALIIFNPTLIKFSELADLLDKIGYEPNFGDRSAVERNFNKQFFFKLGIAGFAFGSIMLWSFPEYLGIERVHQNFRVFSSYLSLLVSIPVLLYSARDYFISAFKAVRYKSINLDVPVTIGIIALYLQSCYSIFKGEGSGYMDSFAGFIFFLLIGKWFQSLTYKSLSFDRDYSSFFPVAVIKINQNKEHIVPIEELAINDTIRLRNNEILPADSFLQDDSADFDFSFITGEAEVVRKYKNDKIFAGARLLGKTSLFKIEKESNRSYLTEIWNKTEAKTEQQKSDPLSIFFLIGLLVISLIGFSVWSFIDPSRSVEILVAILIVACPCALALSAPFTYGNIMRLLGKKGLYLKNTSIIKDLNAVTDIVFDKTGTLTNQKGKARYLGEELTEYESKIVAKVLRSSTHPYSKFILNYLENPEDIDVSNFSFEEFKGKGIIAEIEGLKLKIGSSLFLNNNDQSTESQSILEINGERKGTFYFESNFRENLRDMFKDLSTYNLHVLSGDNPKDLHQIQELSGISDRIFFNQKPQNKLSYIEQLQNEHRKVLMIGDGLNDAGALAKANVSIAISDDVFQFTPSSKAILDGKNLTTLPKLLTISKRADRILNICLVFSILYNCVGLGFALTGSLSPIIAAILMPLSSITVVLLSTSFTYLFKR